MSIADLCARDAIEVADLIRRGEVTSTEVTEAMLARIARLDPGLGSYAYVAGERALRQAEQATKEIRSGIVRGPLHGVPVAVKDIANTEGIPTAYGFAYLRDHVPTRSASVVERLERSGAVLLGKLRMTEGAFAVHNDGRLAPVNPWSRAHWSGHSSSGSGVAAAAALAFATLGSDTGGSIRYPSSANGIVGLKPTWGRVSRAGVFPLSPTMDHVGPMTRSVKDAAAMLAIIAGPDAADPTATARKVPAYLDATPADIRGVRVAIDRQLLDEFVDDEVRIAFGIALDRLRVAGAELLEVKLPSLEQPLRAWYAICGAEAAEVHHLRRQQDGEHYSRGFSEYLDGVEKVDRAALIDATVARLAFAEALDVVLAGVDVLALPVHCWNPPTLDTMVAKGADPAFVDGLLRFTAFADVTGHPALTLPGSLSKEGVPIGFQLIGRRFDEVALFRTGAAYERAGPRLLAPPAQA